MRGFREAMKLTDKDRAAFALLGLTPEASVQEVDSAWRTLRSELHPDRPGGDAAKFDEAKKAYDAARFYALEPKQCDTCEGKGQVAALGQKIGLTFGPPVMVRCAVCKGSGQR